MVAKQQKVFISIWLASVGALLCFPGFETKGLVAGLIIGWWPFVLLGQQFLNELHPLVPYLVMFVLSGVSVGLCAWVMDKACLTRNIWLLLAILMITGACLYFYDGSTFEEWQRSPAISQATEHSGIEPIRWDFVKQIRIPRTIAGGLLGLYLTSGIGLLWSFALVAKRRVHRANKCVSTKPKP